MAHVDTPMTELIKRAVEANWGLPIVGDEVRLPGGEESASYRIGRQVVRIGPEWRSNAELNWSYTIAARVAAEVPEVTKALATSSGAYVVRVGGRPVSVWPYVEGSWADPDDDDQQAQAADLLARLHRALAKPPEPTPRPDLPGRDWLLTPHPDVADRDLDRWLADFSERRSTRQPLHGDVYRRNVLVRAGRIVALVDWDDVILGPPEEELAWTAGEWGRVRRTLDLSSAKRFVEAYVVAGKPADRIGTDELVQLIRGRIRMEVNYSHATGQWGACDDPEECEYEANQLRAFRALRP